MEALADKLDRLTLTELEKTTEAERPPEYHQLRDEQIYSGELRDRFI
jgi:hypothetical protein